MLLPSYAGSGRKVVAVVEVEPAGESPDSSELEPPPVVQMLEQAEELQRLITSGNIANRAELARWHGLTRARVTQFMNLLELHPLVLAYARGLPPGCPPRLVTEHKLRRLTRLPRGQQINAACDLLPGFADFFAEMKDSMSIEPPS